MYWVKYILVSCLAGIGCLSMAIDIDAKVNNFKITDYIPEKFTDFEWTINGSTNAKGQNYDRTGNDSLVTESNSRDNDSQGIRFSTRMNYRYETIPRFLNASMSMSSSYDHGNNNKYEDSNRHTTESETKNKYIRITLNPQLNAGVYLFDDIFISTENSIDITFRNQPSYKSRIYDRQEMYGNQLRYENTNLDSKYNSRNNQFETVFLPGWGRMYSAAYASTALYMIDELNKKGLLARQPSRDEMLALTEIIYQYRLKHPVDRRLLRIRALTAVLDYLKNAGVVDDPGPYGFLLVQDVWDYYPNKYRGFGFKTYFGIGTKYIYGSNDNTDISHSEETIIDNTDTTINIYDSHLNRYHKETETHLFLTGRINYEHPLHRNWQLSANGKVDYDLYTDKDYTDIGYDYQANAFNEHQIKNNYNYDSYYVILLGGSLQYFLDSRTTLRFTSSFNHNKSTYSIEQIRYYNDQNNSQLDTANFCQYKRTWSFSMGVGLTYRVSIPTTLRLGIDYRKYDNKFTDVRGVVEQNSDNYSFSASIYHYIY